MTADEIASERERFAQWYTDHALALWDEQSLNDVLWMVWCAALFYKAKESP